MTHLKVAVRVRPMSQREEDDGSVSVIEVEDQHTIAITNLKVPEDNAGDSRERVRRFSFDFCFPQDATQTHVFEAASSVLSPALRARQNCCVLAYGQSSTGKTHTMLGSPGDPGLAPRLCEVLFDHLREAAVADELSNLTVLVSYLEIYNEKVTDLLRPEEDLKDSKPQVPLRIREHPKKGPYVQGLTERPAGEPATLLRWLDAGTARRRAAATPRNPRSSRSHAVVRLSCAGARLHLVDLAGSEKAIDRCYSRFREGANINKSLVALGNVISALGGPAGGHRQRRQQPPQHQHQHRPLFVPFRDSALTWLLRDTLAGDSNTLLVATVSPGGACHAESLNTLRFGQRARRVVPRPVPAVREPAADRVVRELRAEVARLREQLRLAAGAVAVAQVITLPTVVGNAMSDNSTTEASETVEEDLANSTDSADSGKTFVVTRDAKDAENEVSATEKLVPVMKVLSTVRPAVTSLRRTFSVDRQIVKMDPEKSRSSSSQESLQQSPKHAKRKSLPSLKNSPNTSPRDSLSGQSKSRNGSNSSSIQQSPVRSKPTPTVPGTRSGASLKTIIQKRMLDGAASKASSEPNISKKVDSTKKPPAKPRAQIVAAVTSRLYNKANKKEVATETDPIQEKPNVPKEATICTNARMKLMELTQRALKAHRRKNAETQTQNKNFPVKRLKEVSTDCNDLKLKAKVVKNAEITVKAETTDQAVECLLLEDAEKKLSFTRTCGTQSEGKPPFPCLRFVGYPVGNPPIYAETVNIHVSHNYAGGRNRDSVSDDSLEQQVVRNVSFPTPDLISNHNSLEPHAEDCKLRYGVCGSIHDQVEVNAMFASEDRSAVARCATVAPRRDRVDKVFRQVVYASERAVADACRERCAVFKVTPPGYARVTVVDCVDSICENCVVASEPTMRKSIIKSNPIGVRVISSSSSDEEIPVVPDSLEYHKANAKKVQFRSKKCNHGRIQKAMSNFLEEASVLINHLTTAASKIENSPKPSIFDENYELQVTINDVPDFSHLQSNKSSNDTTQTNRIEKNDNFSQTHLDESPPINKYEALLRDSCVRLEERINRTLSNSRQKNYLYKCGAEENISDDRFAQPLSFNPWSLDVQEDSSLESNPVTFSDYGSLPRRAGKRQRMASCSPSAFLRQLAGVRRQIVESSREDLIDGGQRE